ncbi:sec24-related A, B [Schistosoma mansoni]|uniref:sec24-related A, B n=1 Tax=Schistosoma mansoni TaxID=6183 RepID=UPI0001A645C5|nr:sec24-related A, B [Schistosoma mansoni]|eukprot:XP_018650112.1 sec24-related A, B [Schistosoma mansoni]
MKSNLKDTGYKRYHLKPAQGKGRAIDKRTLLVTLKHKNSIDTLASIFSENETKVELFMQNIFCNPDTFHKAHRLHSMNNPEMPYFPKGNYSGNSIPNADWNDFSHKSPLKQQHLFNSNEGLSCTPQANRVLTQSATDPYQYPAYPNTLNCVEGRSSNESFQNSIPSSGLFTIPSGTQNQLNCSVPQLVSAPPPDYGINGPSVTTNNTNLAYIPTTRPTSEGFLHPPRSYEINSHSQSFPTTNTVSSSSTQLNSLYSPFHANAYPNFNSSNQYNPSVYSPLHSPTIENNQVYTSQGGSNSVCDYTGYSQSSNLECRSSVPFNSGDHPTSEFTNMQAVPQVYGEQQQHSSLNSQFDKPSPILPPNPRTLTPGQNALPFTTAYDMDPSVKSPSLYPPRVTNEAHAVPNSVGSYGMAPPLPPVPMMTNNATYQNHPQPPLPRPGNTLPSTIPRHTAYEQSGVFRTPGTAASISDWSSLKTPINLLQERCLLPSDGPDLPPKPALTTPINCDQDVMRCTLTNVPSTSKLLTQCRLPLGLVMHPFRDMSSLHTISSTTIVRCRSCRTYINPFVQFMDSGRRWRCSVCFLANTIPDEFYYDPGTQTYGDPSRRPEIRSATVEFIAPSEYTVRPPQPATYLFCFDVSHNAIATGYLQLACKRLEALIDRIPGDCRRQIAFYDL